MNLEKKVETLLLKPEIGMIKGEGLLIGVSGGIDSMVLLNVSSALAKKWKWRIIVAHLNHGLRGKEGDEDEDFVCQIAKKLGCEMLVKRRNVKEMARAKGLSIEMAARKVRHDFFAKGARKKGVSRILLAHHADDQLELFFLRLLRGAGSEGLGGMNAISRSSSDPTIQIIRPFLSVQKTELVSFSRNASLDHREDQSNFINGILRNRIRNELIPNLILRYSASLPNIISRNMKLISAEHQFIKKAAEDWLQAKTSSPFDELHVALQREIIRLNLLQKGIVPDFHLVEKLRKDEPHKTHMTRRGVGIHRDEKGRVALTKRQESFSYESIEVKCERQRIIFGSLMITLILKDIILKDIETMKDVWKRSQKCMECFDANIIGCKIIFRFWRPGDRFSPIGLGHSVKVQDYFTNEKVPISQRRRRVISTTEAGKAFWIEGLRIAEGFQVKQKTRKVLMLKWRRLPKA